MSIMANSTKMVVDMSVVFAISGLLFLLEDFANAREWISIGAEARGAPAVVGGSIVAVAVVFFLIRLLGAELGLAAVVLILLFFSLF